MRGTKSDSGTWGRLLARRDSAARAAVVAGSCALALAMLGARPAATGPEGTAAPRASAAPAGSPAATPPVAQAFAALRWRSVGPARGGRSIAVTGVVGRRNEYYFGATGGGLWKSDDGGASWAPTGDGQFKSSSIGAIDVCAANPDVLYVGFGEVQLRGDIVAGDGVYRSNDAGRTFTYLGLASHTAQQVVGRVRVHPTNCDVVYAAVFGDPFGPSEERGVYRSRDGGRTWQRVLYRDPRAGAVDLAITAANPQVIYAGFWEAYRNEWSLSSGGPGSGLFKSSDGGDTWTELTRNPGLPKDLWGKVAIVVSPTDPNRLYANIEARDGGLFASDDAGKTWRLTSGDRNLRTRAFYYTRITADPQDRDTIYVNNESFWRSRDAGVTWEEIRVPHGDNHDLWIDPQDNTRMIHGNDGGATVSVNAGRSWTRERYPTAQMYSARTTAHFPYHICGNQQDEGRALCVPSDGDGTWWYDVGGGESGWAVPDPDDANLYYAGSQTSQLTRFDRSTGQLKSISPWPVRPVGRSAMDVKERFQWQFPIAISAQQPRALYAGSQHLWRSMDKGLSWERISPDLTYADPKTLGPSGGPLTLDRTTVEHYATIFAIAPSPLEANTVWVGSDDGLIHVTRDGGKTWAKVTPPDVPKFSRVHGIESSPHAAGKAFVAITRYRMQDTKPYIWKTPDYGRTWTNVVNGIAAGDHVRAVVEDPKREGLLFAGTENGVYLSKDDGAHWETLQLNLPISPVYSLTIAGNDLVAATHGRSFWVLDDITPLRQLAPGVFDSAHLFSPAEATRTLSVPADGYQRNAAVNGVNIYYTLREAAREVTVDILDAQGEPVRTLTRRAGETPAPAGRRRAAAPAPALEPGLNVIRWDLRYPGFTTFPGLMLRFAGTNGPIAPPGTYRARLTVDGRVVGTESFTVRKDPRLTGVSADDLQQQFQLALKIRDKTSEAHGAVVRIRALRKQLDERLAQVKDIEIRRVAEKFRDTIGAVEREVYEVRLEAPEDQLNFGLKLNNDLATLLLEVETGDGRPTSQHYAALEELSAQLATTLRPLAQALERDLPALNRLFARASVPPVR